MGRELTVTKNKCGKRTDSKRIGWLDSLKGFLIVLVVFGHIILPIERMPPQISFLYDFIYMFHMPLFVFVSGFFAKSAFKDGRLRVNRILSYVFIAFLFNIAVRAIDPGALTLRSVFTFSSAPWYLMSLATWMCIIPLLKSLKPWFAVSAAFVMAIGLAVSPISTDFMSLSRTVSFLPWFALGYYMSGDMLQRVRTKRNRTICIIALVAVTALSVALREQLMSPIMVFAAGNNEASGALLELLGGKCLSLVLAAVMSLGVMALMPERNRVLETLGKSTLPIYVGHRLIRGTLYRYDMYDMPLFDDGWVLMLIVSLLVTAASILVCLERHFGKLVGAVANMRLRNIVADE